MAPSVDPAGVENARLRLAQTIVAHAACLAQKIWKR